jgi:hypothetical protein
MLLENIVPQLLHLDKFSDLTWTQTTNLQIQSPTRKPLRLLELPMTYLYGLNLVQLVSIQSSYVYHVSLSRNRISYC